jgi:hypothetical protein
LDWVKNHRELLKLLVGVVVGSFIVVAVGEVSYEQGIATGKLQANQLRQEFIADRAGPASVGDGVPSPSPQQTPETDATASPSVTPVPRQVILGTISKLSGDTLTLTTRDATTATVNLTETSKVSGSKAGSRDDLAVGLSIYVTGGRSDDGSYTARRVQILPKDQ